MKNGKPKVAIVHDWLVAYAGADRVVDCMHHVFPDAPIYTLVYDENNMPAWFKGYDIRTTYLQKLPFATKLYRAMLPWMPRAFEALDLSEYDMVISSCSSCSKGVITRPDAVHICYCHTPTRYVWDFYYPYRNNANALVRAVMPGQMLKLRQWDKCAADRVDYFIANSHYIAKRISNGLRYQKPGYKEFYSRIGRKFYELEPTDVNDVFAICSANGVTDRKDIDKVIKEASTCDFDLRRVRKSIHKVKRMTGE